jgi:hypothetical protein
MTAKAMASKVSITAPKRFKKEVSMWTSKVSTTQNVLTG